MAKTRKELSSASPSPACTATRGGWRSAPRCPARTTNCSGLSIQKDGIQIPLIAWRHGKRLVVLSGSNRLRIARELGMKTVPVIIRQFADQNAAKAFAVCDNLARRQLTTGQRAYLAYQFQQLLAVGGGRPRGGEILSNLTKFNARQTAAERAGVSAGAVSAIKTVVEDGDDDLLQSVLRGEVAVTAAARYVKMEGRTARLPEPDCNGKPTSGTVCTVVHGDSADLIEQVARLYLRPGAASRAGFAKRDRAARLVHRMSSMGLLAISHPSCLQGTPWTDAR